MNKLKFESVAHLYETLKTGDIIIYKNKKRDFAIIISKKYKVQDDGFILEKCYDLDEKKYITFGITNEAIRRFEVWTF